MTGVWAGETGAVHQKALARVFQQYARCQSKAKATFPLIVGVQIYLPIQRQFDHESGARPMPPGLAGLFNMYRNKPLVRAGRHADHLPSAAR